MKEWLQRMAEELVDDTIYEATMLGLLEAREEAERDDIVEEVRSKRLNPVPYTLNPKLDDIVEEVRSKHPESWTQKDEGG
jgi:hypothetical protein